MQVMGIEKGKKIAVLTAYDYSTAKILDSAGIDLILVGDSLAMVVLGYPNTKSVTMDEMLHHVKAVCRGTKNTHVVADMPVNSYPEPEIALENAKKFIKAGAASVKIEENRQEVVKILVETKIPVMGHIGLTPQTAPEYKLQGKTSETAEKIFQDAKELESAGIYSLVLECIPEALAKRITEGISIPTIGIGAGKFCTGQVLVINDLLGMSSEFNPKFVKRYENFDERIRNAVLQYKKEVSEEKFPSEEHTFH